MLYIKMLGAMIPKRLLQDIEVTFQENGYEIVKSSLMYSDQVREEILQIDMVDSRIVGSLSYDDECDLKKYKWHLTNCEKKLTNILNKLFKKLVENDPTEELILKLDQFLSEKCVEIKRIDCNRGLEKSHILMLFIDQKTYLIEFLLKRNLISRQHPIITCFDDLFLYPWKIVSEGLDFSNEIYLEDIINYK